MKDIEPNPYIQKVERMMKLLDDYNRLLDTTNAVGGLVSFIDKNPLIEIIPYPDKIVIKFRKLEDLSKARELAKVIDHDWKDSIRSIWNPWGEEILVAYEKSPFSNLELWLETSVKEFPIELKPDPECKFERIQDEGSYRLICPTNQNNIGKQLPLLTEVK